MTEVGFVSAVVLAAVFAVAGGVKLSRRSETAVAFAGLRLPAPRALAAGVPVFELSVAVALLVAPRVGGALAAAALVVFTGVILRSIASGVAASCGCFGTARAEPVSSVEVVRNVLLLALAVAALWAPEPVRPGLEAVVLVTTAGVLGTVVLAALDLRRQLGRIWDNRLAGEGTR